MLLRRNKEKSHDLTKNNPHPSSRKRPHLAGHCSRETSAAFVAGGGVQRIAIPLADDQQTACVLKTPPAFLHRAAAGVGLSLGQQVFHRLVVGGNVLLAVFFKAFALDVVKREADIGVCQLPRRQRPTDFDEIEHIAF
jgi:hypothetical protein